jgi:hypothetical protein
VTDEPDDDMSDALEAVAWLPAATDEDLFAELARRGLDNPDSIGDYAEQRARVERQRTLTDARAAVALFTTAHAAVMLTEGTPDGIRAAFDQWALSEYHTLADPDRRLCPDCGGRHTQYEYDDAHRNDEGDY